MNYDGQYYRADSIGDIATKAKGFSADGHVNINDTFEQLAATWTKHAQKLAAGRARWKKKG